MVSSMPTILDPLLLATIWYSISANSFRPWIVSVPDQRSQYIRFNSKKNSFHGNYLRKYGNFQNTAEFQKQCPPYVTVPQIALNYMYIYKCKLRFCDVHPPMLLKTGKFPYVKWQSLPCKVWTSWENSASNDSFKV